MVSDPQHRITLMRIASAGAALHAHGTGLSVGVS
jgi:hypothetical protein